MCRYLIDWVRPSKRVLCNMRRVQMLARTIDSEITAARKQSVGYGALGLVWAVRHSSGFERLSRGRVGSIYRHGLHQSHASSSSLYRTVYAISPCSSIPLALRSPHSRGRRTSASSLRLC